MRIYHVFYREEAFGDLKVVDIEAENHYQAEELFQSTIGQACWERMTWEKEWRKIT